MAQEKDWADRLVDIMIDWMDSLKENPNETQNLGKWTYSVSEKRQGQEETSSSPTSKGKA